ncbi:acyl-CoA dehydrogenase family protein [Saccharothrix longispora]|nr:acyl-CoA dehydrogenase family protein [Saccharothrix longispora]MDU0287706.1 acyl-CoA dehydrogenase family protein [Saccharothrix longispora]
MVTTTDTARPAVLEAVRELVPTLRANGAEADANGWIPQENIDLLGQAGVFAMAVPGRFGGLDLPLAEKAAVLTEIARGCPSTGWVSMVWVSTAWMVSLFPDKAQEEVYGSGAVRVSGGFTPGGTLTPVDGGYRLSGTWRFNTGSKAADWNMMAAVVAGPDGPVGESVALVPLSDMTLADDWDVSAARGTGSVSSTATDVFVPAHRVADAEKAVLGTLDDRSNTGATGRDYCLYPLVLAESLAAFVGMARGAYELFTGRLNGRGISYSSWTDQSAHPLTHVQVATAANKITAAEAMLDRMVGVIQRRADEGVQPTWEERADIRGQSAFAIELAKEAVDLLYNASGATVIARNVPLQRFQRDVRGMGQHGLLNVTTGLEVQGRVLLGLDPQNYFL